MRRTVLVSILAALWVAVLVSPVAAQSSVDNDSVLVRVNGDATVAPGESHGLVVVVSGNLQFDGTADTVVIVDGTVDMGAATVDTLVVVRATASLGPDTVVNGDVFVVDAVLNQDPASVIQGTIQDDVGWEAARGFWVVGLLLMIGWALLALFSGFLLAAVAPRFARQAGQAITARLGSTIVAALLLWIVVPIAGVLLFATVVGVPTALALWLVALPVLGFLGLLVSGIRLGESIVARQGGVGRPYLASAVGIGVLIVVGAIPVLGPIVLAIAGFLGSGAIASMAAGAVRADREPHMSEPLAIP